MKVTKLKKHKSSITEYKKLLVNTYPVLQRSCLNFFNTWTPVKNKILKTNITYYYKGILI